MKRFFIIALAFLNAIALHSQTKTEILLVGTAHQASTNILQDTSTLIRAIRKFEPDAIAIEVIPNWDSISLRNYRLKYLLNADSVKAQHGWTNSFIMDRIRNLANSVDWDKQDCPLYDSLGYYYILDGDVYGNSGYNWFIAKRLNSPDSNCNSEFTATALFQWSWKFLENSEFATLIYPFALESRIQYLHPVDDQTDALKFKTYQNKLTKSMIRGVFVFNFKGLKVQKLIKKQQANFKNAEQKGKIYDLVNEKKFQEEVSELLENIYPKYSKSKWAKRLKETWDMRNERIAERIINVLDTSPSTRKIVVFIGAAHITALKKILLRSGTVHVKTISDFDP